MYCRFDEIKPAVEKGGFDAGMLISEDQMLVNNAEFDTVDLGQWWNRETGLALPLGIDLVDASLPEELKSRINRVFRRSIEYAIAPSGAGRGIRAEIRPRHRQSQRDHLHCQIREQLYHESREKGETVDPDFPGTLPGKKPDSITSRIEIHKLT